jgi:hypothetical protein
VSTKNHRRGRWLRPPGNILDHDPEKCLHGEGCGLLCEQKLPKRFNMEGGIVSLVNGFFSQGTSDFIDACSLVTGCKAKAVSWRRR